MELRKAGAVRPGLYFTYIQEAAWLHMHASGRCESDPSHAEQVLDGYLQPPPIAS